MLAWLRRLFAADTPQRPTDEVLAGIHVALAGGDIRAWSAGLDELCGRQDGGFDQHQAELAARLRDWFGRHPFEVAWTRDYQFQVGDPLGVTTEALIRDPEDPQLASWARLLRTFEVVTGEVVFHHGCGLGDLTALLRDPNAPLSIESLPVPFVIVNNPAEVDEFFDLLCKSDQFGELRHLALGRSAITLDGRHIEQLARAPWAGSLETLDLTERMVDWFVDRGDAERHAALRALSAFQSVTHLVMVNNFGDSADLAVFLEARFPALTHLHLGAGPKDAGVCELLATTTSLPNLQELCFGGGPARTDPAWDRLLDASFPVYLHGRRVTAEYPKRTA